MFHNGVVHKSFVIGTLLTIALWTACGGSMSSSGGGGTPPRGSTSAVVNVTDSPSDRVVSFEVTINSVSLIAADGTSTVVISSPRRLEVTHASGSAEPLGVTVFPQGTFTSAKVDVSNPDVVFIDDSGHAVEKKNSGSTTITIPFSPALVVGATPVVLTIDFNAAGSINIDVANNTVTVNPTADARHDDVPGSGAEAGEDVENGEFEHFVGQVSGISGTSFTVSSNGGSVTFATDSTTSFEENATFASLNIGSMVRVEAHTQQNGTPLASEVEILSSIANETEGIIISTSGSPTSGLTVVVQDGSGSGMNDSALGSTLTVHFTERTRFRVDTGNIDLGGLNLSDLNASTLSKGLRVEVDSDAAPSNGAVNAESVKLLPQALTGTISNVGNSQFTLTLADDSAFKLLTGAGTLTVLTQRNTETKNITISNGATAKVRGLVFFVPDTNPFTMVAGRISAP